jgi:hypothetical protein
LATPDATSLDRLRGATLLRARSAVLVRRVPLVLAVLVLVGIGLRVAVSVLYRPALMNSADSTVYLLMANQDLFIDPVRPAGYSIFLRAMHGIWSDLDFTIVAQHVIGVVTALLLYAAARRLGAPLWAAAAAAAAVLLPLDQIVLEHTLMAESLFTLGLAIVIYACVRTLDESRRLAGAVTTRHLWILAAAIALGLTAWVRVVAAPLIPFLGLWIALAVPGRWRERLGRGALAAVSAAAVLLAYFSLNTSATGHFSLTYASGWGLYSRIAPVAECSEFDPPAGTEALCEETPPADRNGPDFYGWQPGSPAVQLFGGPPIGDDELLAFARQAITHQPTRYAELVVRDTARYFVPDYRPYPFGGPGYESLDIERRAPPLIEGDVNDGINGYYSPETLVIEDGVGALGEVQDWLRVQPLLMMAALIAGAIGVALAKGRQRAGLVLLLGAALLLFVIPSATASYSARYAIPAAGPLIAAGALGASLLFARYRGRRVR